MSTFLRAFVLLACLGLGLSPNAPAVAQPAATNLAGAEAFIADLSGRAIAVLRDQSIEVERREAIFRDMLRDGFDLDFIGRFVLGRFWTPATPAERAEYQSLFGDYVLKTYSNRLGGYAGQQFAVAGAQMAGKNDIMVKSKITRTDGPPLAVDWRVRPVGAKFKIVDVVVEELSMSLSQRQEFASVVQAKGMSGLLEALRSKTGPVEPAASGPRG